MYSKAEDHLANLDHCASRALRQAYLVILLAAVQAGYLAMGHAQGDIHELQIRDKSGRQPFALVVNGASLLFCLRRPALMVQPELGGQAMVRFGDHVLGEGNSPNEVRIRITTEVEAERIAEWLFAIHSVTPEYAARISA